MRKIFSRYLNSTRKIISLYAKPYEHPILIKQTHKGDSEKLRIWYPDFWLPKYSIIIEFFGMRNSKDYDNETKKKKEAYRKLDIDLIPVYPKTITPKLGWYLLCSIGELINDKVRHFEGRRKKK